MKREHIEAMDGLVSEFAHLNVLRDAIRSQMVEILRRHPREAELPFKSYEDTMLYHQVVGPVGPGLELIPGCGCTYHTGCYSLLDEPPEEHPDGRRLQELEDAERHLGLRTAEATKKLAELLIAIGVG